MGCYMRCKYIIGMHSLLTDLRIVFSWRKLFGQPLIDIAYDSANICRDIGHTKEESDTQEEK